MMRLLSKHNAGGGLLLAASLLIAFTLIGVTQAQAFTRCGSGSGATTTTKTFGELMKMLGGNEKASPLYLRSEFEDFIESNATGFGSFGYCSRLMNGNFLGLAYVCQNATDTANDANCLCLAEYNGTACSSCTACNASAPAALANFQADCSNVNGKCKIECGQGVATPPEEGDSTVALFDSSVIAETTKEVCPYPAGRIPSPAAPPTEESPPSSSPPSSNGARPQPQLKSACWTLSVLVATLSWIY